MQRRALARLCALERQPVPQQDGIRVCADEGSNPDFGQVATGPLPQFPHLSAGSDHTGTPACGLNEQRLQDALPVEPFFREVPSVLRLASKV